MDLERISWYVHRLRAMEMAEIFGHVRKKRRQRRDREHLPASDRYRLERADTIPFPGLEPPAKYPAASRAELREEVDEILKGKWLAFGHLPIQVDDPPLWQKDYLAGKDVWTEDCAFDLDHRNLPDGADVKLIWELSRWNQLVRLAQARYLLDDFEAGKTCIRWLLNWIGNNLPYQGWNWTSALEAGLRLIQFFWIDALLDAADCWPEDPEKFEQLRLRRLIVPHHAWFTWRYHSIGSSANNHSLGELAGLIMAVTRWPGIAKCCAPLDELQALWEREVPRQFAEDGGNREQALNYHLFPFELCWQTRFALLASGKTISPQVEERLRRAAEFYTRVQVPSDPWDYGDSDSAYVTPLFSREGRSIAEWHRWMAGNEKDSTISFWLGKLEDQPRADNGPKPLGKFWNCYPDSGMAMAKASGWTLRWDLSPLGFHKTAAHGHLDALHLSIWFEGQAIVIDPGTGAYYGDAPLRNHLASRETHNGPAAPEFQLARRLGPFLWGSHHGRPVWSVISESEVEGRIGKNGMEAVRTITRLDEGDGWKVTDRLLRNGRNQSFQTCWQFAPECHVEPVNKRTFKITRDEIQIEAIFSDQWKIVELHQPASNANAKTASLDGICSRSFRMTEISAFITAKSETAGEIVFRRKSS